MKCIMIEIDTLKELFRIKRRLREQNERYLRIINRWRLKREEEEIAEAFREREGGTDRYQGLFNFRF